MRASQRRERNARATETPREVGLADRAHHKPSELSGGPAAARRNRARADQRSGGPPGGRADRQPGLQDQRRHHGAFRQAPCGRPYDHHGDPRRGRSPATHGASCGSWTAWSWPTRRWRLSKSNQRLAFYSPREERSETNLVFRVEIPQELSSLDRKNREESRIAHAHRRPRRAPSSAASS